VRLTKDVTRALEIRIGGSSPDEVIVTVNNRSELDLAVATVVVAFFDEGGAVVAVVEGRSDSGGDAIEGLAVGTTATVRVPRPEGSGSGPYDVWAYGRP
jgi:hypothetical protein